MRLSQLLRLFFKKSSPFMVGWQALKFLIWSNLKKLFWNWVVFMSVLAILRFLWKSNPVGSKPACKYRWEFAGIDNWPPLNSPLCIGVNADVVLVVLS